MIEFEVDADAQRCVDILFDQIGGPSRYVENRERIVLRHFAQQTAINALSAIEPIETSEVTEGTLHVFARRIVFIEKLGSIDAPGYEQSDSLEDQRRILGAECDGVADS